jgi:hypothetical protein
MDVSDVPPKRRNKFIYKVSSSLRFGVAKTEIRLVLVRFKVLAQRLYFGKSIIRPLFAEPGRRIDSCLQDTAKRKPAPLGQRLYF